jgi:solute carrier family 25 carnitine/acylcarnitine transporter 20/29
MQFLDAEEIQGDNLQYRLRERLFYHMLNYSLDIDAIALPALPNGPATITYQTTLLFPTTHEEHGRPGHVPYPDPEDTLLGGEGQKVVISRQDAQDGSSNATILIGQDELGNGGTLVLSGKGGQAKNGRVYAVGAVLDPPKSLQHQIKARSHPEKPKAGEASLSRFAGLLTEDLWKALLERSHLTLFAPRDEAFDALEPLEWRYLNSGFAADDILQIASNHESEYGEEGREKVGYLDRLLQQQTGGLHSASALL